MQICLHCLLQTQIECITNQCMTDRHFQKPWDVLCKEGQVVEIEIVASVKAETDLLSREGGLMVRREYRLLLWHSKHFGITLSVQLNAVGADIFSTSHLLRIRLQKKAGANAVLV